MTTKFRLRSALVRYARKEGGAVIPLVGLAFVVLIGMMGMAIDIGRAQLVEAKLLNSLDAAGLAAGAKLNTSDLNTEVQRFVASNFPKGYVDAVVSNVQATLSADETTITVTGTAVVPTTFMQIFGKQSIDINVTSEITRAVGGLELVLVLDNTGSMCSPCSKLANLKTAATNLINIVFGDNETGNDLYVGLVPFSQSVNIGPSRTSWMDMTEVNALDWGPSGYGWGGCVEARTDGPDLDSTDDPPSVRLFDPYYWEDDDQSGTPSSNNNDWWDIVYAMNEPRPGYPDYFDYAFREAAPNMTPIGHRGGSCTSCWCNSNYCTPTTVYDTPLDESNGPNKNCPAELLPMTTTKSTITAAINSMEARGNTHVNFGAAWGWRMLSPRWRNVWGGEMDANELPLDYNTPQMTKAAVIMTDGDNTMSSSIYTAYEWLSDGNLGTTSSSGAVSQLNSRLLAVCTAMKNAGIVIYGVTFGTNVSSTGQSLMRNCASQADYYFHAPSGADLETAFAIIGDSLTNLRVSR